MVIGNKSVLLAMRADPSGTPSPYFRETTAEKGKKNMTRYYHHVIALVNRIQDEVIGNTRKELITIMERKRGQRFR